MWARHWRSRATRPRRSRAEVGETAGGAPTARTDPARPAPMAAAASRPCQPPCRKLGAVGPDRERRQHDDRHDCRRIGRDRERGRQQLGEGQVPHIHQCARSSAPTPATDRAAQISARTRSRLPDAPAVLEINPCTGHATVGRQVRVPPTRRRSLRAVPVCRVEDERPPRSAEVGSALAFVLQPRVVRLRRRRTPPGFATSTPP